MDSKTCAAILLVEDDDALCEQVATFLSGEGFQVYTASSSVAALPRLADMPRPALVLADLLSPAIDGPTIVAALEPSDRFAILPTVVAARTNATLPLPKKPIDFADLLKIVSSLCRRRI